MKNYFKFNLTGKQILPFCLAFMVLIIIPYVYVIYNMTKNLADTINTPKVAIADSIKLMLITVFVILIIGSILYFFIEKLTIEHTEYKEERFSFDGRIGQFIGLFIKGLLLSIITLGIYAPWFIEKIYDFYFEKTSHNSNRLQFFGTGLQLFKIILLYYILPIVFVTIVIRIIVGHTPEEFSISNTIRQIVTIFIAIPFMYLRYKWLVNIKYKDYRIEWETEFWSSCKTILFQVFLSVITLGIYYPLAMVKLYKYFAHKTVAVSETKTKKFGYDIEPKADFLFIWGQSLLTLFTLGIYYPWAYCKIIKRIMGKSYTEDVQIVK